MPINEDIQVFGLRNTKEADLRSKSKKTSLYGLNFPVTYTDGNGYFSKMSSKKLYQRNISQLIKTTPGERVMLPDYGINLKKYLFQPKSSYLFNTIRSDIRNVLTKYASWVIVENIDIIMKDRFESGFIADLEIKIYLRTREEDSISFDVKLEI